MDALHILLAATDDARKPLFQPGPDGADRPVLRTAPPSPLHDRIRGAVGTGFLAQAVKLDRYARQLVLNEQGTGEQGGPVYLMLSDEEGGFAREGFWLQGEAGESRYVSAPYINMVVDETAMERGTFERIFSHELAHTTLRTLMGDLTHGSSRKMHQSFTVTDYPTAFDEGWAEHFEVLVVDATENPWLLGRKQGRVSDLIATWLSNVDAALRQDGVRGNLFVHEKPSPQSGSDPFQQWVEYETTSSFLIDQLKSAQAMLSCEGVGSTLFYRIVTSEALRSRYLDAHFYARFLPSAEQVAAGPAEKFTPYENINLKLFAVMREMARHLYDPARPLLLELVQTYGALFPEEAGDLYQLFLEITWGATVSHELAAFLCGLAYEGRTGNLAAFQQGIGGAVQRLGQLKADLLAGRIALNAAVGPELWLLNDSVRIPKVLWQRERRELPLSINLNTASETDLVTIDGIDRELAGRILAARRAMGFFPNLEALIGIPGVTPALMDALRRMQAHMEQAGAVERI